VGVFFLNTVYYIRACCYGALEIVRVIIIITIVNE